MPPPKSIQDLERAQAKFLGVEYEEFRTADTRMRNAMRARHMQKLRKYAKENKLDEEKYVVKEMFKYPGYRVAAEAEEEKEVVVNGQVLRRVSPEDMKAAQEKTKQNMSVTESADEEEDEEEEDEESMLPDLPPSVVEQDGVKVYVANGKDVIKETDPTMRDGITVGEIRELEKPPVPDLVGDKSPRTITDLYARWPIATDSSYFIRVERTRPKRFGNVDVSGYLGDIRGMTIKESDIHRWLGGTEYLLTLYGPDPRNRRDGEGLPIVKPLTDPIKVVVPVVPPNLAAIPAIQGEAMSANQTTVNPMNPFAPIASPMTNQHDASMHKTNMDLVTTVLKMNKTDEAEKAKVEAAANTSMFSLLADTQKQNTEAVKEAAKERASAAEKRLEDEKEARKRAEEKLEKLSEEIRLLQNKSQDPDQLYKLATVLGPNREEESKRLAENYRAQVDQMRNAHESAMKTLLDRHAEDMKRADVRHADDVKRMDDRLRDMEVFYKKGSEEDRRKFEDRERQLRDDLDKVRREERERCEERIREAKERYESELKNLERAHTIELRTAKENWEMRLNVTDTQHKMQLENMTDKLQDAQEEAERAREEAKEAGDPVKVMEKAKEQAEAMGFQKVDDAPKTMADRLFATAGAGLGQALATIQDWGPKMMAARAAQMQAAHPMAALAAAGGTPLPQLPPQQQQQALMQQHQQQQVAAAQRQQQAAAQQQRRRRRGAQWATENANLNTPVTPDTPLGFQSAQEVPQNTAAQQQPMQNTQEMQAVPQDDPYAAYNFPDKILQHFEKPAIVGFLAQVDQHINLGTDASTFAQMFVAQFPNEASRMVSAFEHQEILDAVAGLDGSEESAILRTDGKKWVESLWNNIRKEIQAKSA